MGTSDRQLQCKICRKKFSIFREETLNIHLMLRGINTQENTGGNN